MLDDRTSIVLGARHYDEMIRRENSRFGSHLLYSGALWWPLGFMVGIGHHESGFGVWRVTDRLWQVAVQPDTAPGWVRGIATGLLVSSVVGCIVLVAGLGCLRRAFEIKRDKAIYLQQPLPKRWPYVVPGAALAIVGCYAKLNPNDQHVLISATREAMAYLWTWLY